MTYGSQVFPQTLVYCSKVRRAFAVSGRIRLFSYNARPILEARPRPPCLSSRCRTKVSVASSDKVTGSRSVEESRSEVDFQRRDAKPAPVQVIDDEVLDVCEFKRLRYGCLSLCRTLAANMSVGYTSSYFVQT